jgi:hypothetical protein
VATVFDRFEDWLARQWHFGVSWLASHVGTEEPREPRTDDRFLGVPRLPRAIEVPDVEVDSMIVAPPLDTAILVIPPLPDTLDPDTLGLGLDTLALDTLPPDTLRPDTVPRR